MTGKYHEHRQIDATGNGISTGNVRAKRLILKDHGQQQFGGQQQTQGNKSSAETSGNGRRDGESPHDESCRDQNDCEHERHFAQFSKPFPEAGHQEGNTQRTEDETGAKHQPKVREAGLD